MVSPYTIGIIWIVFRMNWEFLIVDEILMVLVFYNFCLMLVG